MVAVQPINIVQIHYGQHADKSCQEVGTIEAGECVSNALEGDECLCHAKPVGSPPACLLYDPIDILVHGLVDHLLLQAVDFWPFVLEFVPLGCLFLDEVKGEPQVILPLRLEVKESIWPLKLVEVPLDVVVVVDILLDLGSPLATLLIIHEILTVHVVEVDPDLGAEWVGVRIGGLGLVLDSEVEP